MPLIFIERKILMKRIIAMTLSLALALSMCGCKNKDKKEDKKTSATSVEFHEISPETEPKEKFDVEEVHQGIRNKLEILNSSIVVQIF